MRDGDAVARTQAAEMVASDYTGKAPPLGDADYVDELARKEMRRRYLDADVEKRVLGDAELHELFLGFELRLGEMAAHRLADVFHLGLSGAQLNRGIAILLRGPNGNHLTVIDGKHCDRHVIAIIGEHARHAELLGDETGAHPHILKA